MEDLKIGEARMYASEWVEEQASKLKGFWGAYYSGSTIMLADAAELSPSSDLDIMIILDSEETPLKIGKFVYKGVLIEASYLSKSQFNSVEDVLAHYHLANSFQVNTIIADPTGELGQIQKQVAHHFAEKKWVERRSQDALKKVENGLRSIDESAPWHDQVTSWLFPTGVTTHVLLVAGLENPTVRKRYLAVKKVLSKYGYDEVYDKLIALLGCQSLTPECVEAHLDALAHTFDVTTSVAQTPFFFSSDISASSRVLAIDGSRDLIRAGDHREAVFWILATFARCHKILAADAPEREQELAPAFNDAVAELVGITSIEDLFQRAEDGLQFLPKLWEVAEAIIAANPIITE
ncbi:hypothetical protein [Pullulanibacillus pueri]|uniref:hypothetical protein n=1 Tax=Pullulanibacillus pueri TaxID=1437324 RepID=UPI0027E4FB5F|nr:hypothetical protein [Pullulanibacillus pueri]